MNILKVLSWTTWSSDEKCLLNFYKGLIRTCLNYGAVVYGCATSSALKMLDRMQHLGNRLSIGAFRYSPVESPYMESNGWSLHLQRCYMSFIHFLKVKAEQQHPYDFTNNDWFGYWWYVYFWLVREQFFVEAALLAPCKWPRRGNRCATFRTQFDGSCCIYM